MMPPYVSGAKAAELFAASGALSELSAQQRRSLLTRTPVRNGSNDDSSLRVQTAQIIERVRTDGDNALFELARRFDRSTPVALEVPRQVWLDALASIDDNLRAALERSARNIVTVHKALLPRSVEISPEPGVLIGRRPDPLGRVGVYAPGGRASYPSSLLMGAIPARVAGVAEIIVCSPPGDDGLPSRVVLAAAAIANVDRLFAVGGAGAIAAMALGTETIPRVDRIVGPGNAFVAAAKLQLVDQVAIDSPAGPSELLVIADDDSDPDAIADELIAQAEHDADAAVVAVVTGNNASVALERIAGSILVKLESLPRAAIVLEALSNRGALLSSPSLDSAIDFSNEWAPEHLMLMISNDDESREVLDRVRNTGAIFSGSGGSVSFGDYLTGANHVLPTAGLARCYSGLSTLDFFRWTTWQTIDKAAATRMAADTSILALAEGLSGHARAAVRAGGGNSQ